MSKERWEKILGRKFDEPKVVNGQKQYMPGDTVTVTIEPEKWILNGRQQDE